MERTDRRSTRRTGCRDALRALFAWPGDGVPVALPHDDASPRWFVAFAASLIVLALKAPDSLTHSQLYAEDGSYFFAEQHGHLLPRLGLQYGGYLHFIPRLVAWASTAFPSVFAPTLYAWAALLIGSAALTSLRTLRLHGVPFVLVLLAVALTPTNGEVFGTLTNVQWLLQFYQLGILARAFHAPFSHRPFLRSGIAALVGLSGPFCIFTVGAFFFVFVGSVVASRRTPERASAARITPEVLVLVACAVVQLLVIVTTPPIDGPVVNEAKDVARVISYVQAHVLGSAILGPRAFRFTLFAFALLSVAAAPTASTRRILIAAQVYVALALAAVLRKGTVQIQSFSILAVGDRYYVVIKALVWWQLAMLVARLVDRAKWDSGWRFAIVGSLLGLAAARTGPLQRRALDELPWADYARRIDRGEAVEAPINPTGWFVRIRP